LRIFEELVWMMGTREDRKGTMKGSLIAVKKAIKDRDKANNQSLEQTK